MNLDLHFKYKSFEPFSVELPNLTVLTGLNGAGKTQILTAITETKATISENNIHLHPVKFVNNSTLSPNDSTIVTNEMLSKESNALWSAFNTYLKHVDQGNQDELEKVIRDPRQAKSIRKIALDSNKEINLLTIDDFHNYIPIDAGLGLRDIFHHTFSNLFKRYSNRAIQNKFNKFLNQHEGITEAQYLDDAEFIAKYGDSPWTFANTLFEAAKLDYQINSPIGLNPEVPFELKLTNKINNSEIKFSELSSGEKVLMSLILALYNSRSDMDFPKVLLLDEADASLHPAMSKQFLNVIQNVFIAEKGMKVILTTHSPSTVALAPEESIYVVNKTGERIEKVGKDRALKILTAGVPSFSVAYENRRQVFVESQNDVAYYEKLYEILVSRLNPEISLNFISSGESATDKFKQKISNCSQVINITKILRNKGNTTIWGIIDWDLKNRATEYVKVLGEGNRYSIENYLLDPLLIAALLLREKYITREEIGLNKQETYVDLKTKDSNELQKIADYIVNKVGLNVKHDKKDCKTHHILNGIEISVPLWYIQHQGHALEEAVLKTFPDLNKRKQGKEDALKLELLKVADDIPELISVEILEIFQQIQTA